MPSGTTSCKLPPTGYRPGVPLGRIDAWRTRWPALGLALDTNERAGAIGGGPLASSIALSGFLSVIPLLLVAVAAIGWLSAGDATFASRFVDNLGLRGEAGRTILDSIEAAERSRKAASIVGVAGLLWSGIAVVGSLQTALNAAWQVTGRGIKDRLFALVWLLGAAVLYGSSVAISATLNRLPGALAALSVVAALPLSVLAFVWTFKALTNAPLGWRVHLPGAITAGLGFEMLKLIGTLWVPRMVSSSSATYGALGAVFALLGWLALHGRLFVLSACLNVVLYERDHGTVRVDLEAPRVEGTVPLEATRGGAVTAAG